MASWNAGSVRNQLRVVAANHPQRPSAETWMVLPPRANLFRKRRMTRCQPTASCDKAPRPMDYSGAHAPPVLLGNRPAARHACSGGGCAGHRCLLHRGLCRHGGLCPGALPWMHGAGGRAGRGTMGGLVAAWCSATRHRPPPLARSRPRHLAPAALNLHPLQHVSSFNPQEPSMSKHPMMKLAAAAALLGASAAAFAASECCGDLACCLANVLACCYQ